MLHVYVKPTGGPRTQSIPPGLAKVIAAWPELPSHIRAAIETLNGKD